MKYLVIYKDSGGAEIYQFWTRLNLAKKAKKFAKKYFGAAYIYKRQ